MKIKREKIKFRKIFVVAVCALMCIISGLVVKKCLGKQSDTVAVKTEVFEVKQVSQAEKYVIPSGMPVGIYVKTKGVMVTDIKDVVQIDGSTVSPCKDMLLPGDYIISADGYDVNNKKSLIEIVSKTEGKKIKLEIKRNDQTLFVEVTPVQSLSGNYLLGIWVKDDVSGIGTLTFIDGDSFGGLGHSINDTDTGEIFQVSDGAIYNIKLSNIKKPMLNMPGRLEGSIDYSGSNILGRVSNNVSFGIRGVLTELGQNVLENEEVMNAAQIGRKEEIEKGDACIISAVSGERKEYKISILDVDTKNEDGSKGILFKVEDEELISLTGGIVQGMSGSPIMQDGKLVGAVTHVFVDDPTKGYGIFIEEMLEQ